MGLSGFMETWLTRDTMFGVPIDDVFSFRTAKIVRVQDRTLGFIDLAMKALITAFVVFVLFISKTSYLVYEPVTGMVSVDLLGTLRGVNSTKLSYCHGETPCRFVDRHVLVRSDLNQDQLFVSTYMSEHEQTRECDADADVCNRKSPFSTTKLEEFYPVGVEDMQVIVTHEGGAPIFFSKTRSESFRAQSKKAEGTIVSYRDDGTGRVRLNTLSEVDPKRGLRMTVAELVSYAGLEWERGLRMTVAELVSYVGLDLDKPVSGHSANEKGEGSTLRKTGAQIICRVRYMNDYQWINPATPKYQFECVPSQQQALITSSNYEVVGFGDARMLVRRTGLRVQFVIEGEFGRFSLVKFLTTLAIAALLVNFGSWVLVQIATRFVPVAERYEAAKYEYTENVYNLRQSLSTFNDQVIEGTSTVEERLDGLLGSLPKQKYGTSPAAALLPAAGGYGAVERGGQDLDHVGGGDGAQRLPPMYPHPPR